MRLVIDTNQARLIPATLGRSGRAGRTVGVSLPPYTVAEVLLRGPEPRKDTLERLRAHDVRIGAESRTVLETIAQLQAADIPRFEPFPAYQSELDRLSNRLLGEDRPTVDAGALEWAETVKAFHLSLTETLGVQSGEVRTQVRAQGIARAQTFDDAVRALATAPGSFLESLVLSSVSGNGGRPVVVNDSARLYRAVMRNPYLRHFFHGMLFYLVSISRLWADQSLNRDAQPTRDDWTDVVLTLYVGQRDLVLSADRLIRDIFAAIDPTISVLTAADL